jgi:pimeloyl-ACP methyl ester carboxylesterase
MVPDVVEVPVEGGAMAVGVWDAEPDAPVVVAAHGITASHVAWHPVAQALDGRVRLVAPDLRGRGASADLPGPWGMKAHARDLVAVASHFGAERPLVVGHSMGGWVVSVMAADYPERVGRLLMVDGGLPIPLPPGLSAEDAVQAVIGPAMARLSMTFASRDEYRAFWRNHPALGPWWSPEVEAYVDYDLTGTEPDLRSRVSRQAVVADSEDTLGDPTLGNALHRAQCVVEVLRAERGMLDNPEPLFPDASLEGFPVVDLGVVPDTNHYTIGLAPHGAAAVVDAILKAQAAL